MLKQLQLSSFISQLGSELPVICCLLVVLVLLVPFVRNLQNTSFQIS